MNRLVLANLSKGQGNCTDTIFISLGMRVVVHVAEIIPISKDANSCYHTTVGISSTCRNVDECFYKSLTFRGFTSITTIHY